MEVDHDFTTAEDGKCPQNHMKCVVPYGFMNLLRVFSNTTCDLFPKLLIYQMYCQEFSWCRVGCIAYLAGVSSWLPTYLISFFRQVEKISQRELNRQPLHSESLWPSQTKL